MNEAQREEKPEDYLEDYAKNIPVQILKHDKYVYTSEMGEISGFGGGYEDTCRNMVVAGLVWMDDHPKADPQFKGYKDVYGILDEDNDEAKELTKAVVCAALDDCTGAMHQSTISHILFINKNGWDKYKEDMIKRETGS
jgi:hypothetical protein